VIPGIALVHLGSRKTIRPAVIIESQALKGTGIGENIAGMFGGAI
jgi:hypothetical protein